ncbi:uncharacterized protein MONOS_17876 [Monocercomonoides exilis]|uniref:uncharacterized protein n=1 Tax=Monocercomonoides exilis TaxID=2049356 RepID=UPI00355A7E2D|nr:hypothetical protein MONOS_17876 [Monocercomonoides exilis]
MKTSIFESIIERTSPVERFWNLFGELGGCNEDEQKRKIKAINRVMDEMNEGELESIFETDLFNKIDKMIEEKKMSLKDSALMLKHIGYCKIPMNLWNRAFVSSSLDRRFKEMIFEEEKKKKEKNEKHLIDLCECYIFLCCHGPSQLSSICLPHILKAALNKEENEEAQKEVEMALLALACMCFFGMKNEVYLKGIKEIIQHHQEHRNLTQLAYQSAWECLAGRVHTIGTSNRAVVDELHFVREAARELEELRKRVNWKGNKKEGEERSKKKEETALMRWIQTIKCYFFTFESLNDELVGLVRSIVQVLRAAKNECREISVECNISLRRAAWNKAVKVDDLLKGGAVDVLLEEIQLPNLDDTFLRERLSCFRGICQKLKERKDDKTDEEEIKPAKRNIFVKMEEEGYEDFITSLHKMLPVLANWDQYLYLSKNSSDYLLSL